MQVFGRTDVGRVRPNNQDAFICGALNEGAAYAVVCDGMGGVGGGQIASTKAVQVVADRIVDAYRDSMSENAIRNLLESAVSAANALVFDMACNNNDLRGMGTTVVAAIATADKLHIVHIGDSRAYLIYEQRIEQITRDHSIVQSMVEKGELTADEAKHHPRKNLITRALGVEKVVEPDYTERLFPPSGLLLICTDGLTNVIDPEEIFRLVRTTALDQLADRLTVVANTRGGSDNTTVVLIAHDDRGENHE